MEAQARNAYNRTRALFAASFKSANKKYADSSVVGAEKYARRLANQSSANDMMLNFSARVGNYTEVQRGNNIIAQSQGPAGMAGGNCVEMTWVALAYLRQQSQTIRAHIVCITSPGDHVFLHVGLVPPCLASPMPLRVSNFSATPPTWDSYVVDPWADIFCDALVYQNLFEAKMAKWVSRRKEVFRGTGWALPDPNYAADNMQRGPLEWYPR